MIPATKDSDRPPLYVLGSFTGGEWREAAPATSEAAEIVDGPRGVAGALSEELGSILSSETLVVLAGSGTSLGIPSGGHSTSAPSMGALWNDVAALPEFDEVRESLSRNLIESGNLEHVLSDAQARHAVTPDSKLEGFISAAERVVLTRCSFVTQDTELTTHELFLRKAARRSARLHRTQLFTTNYDIAFETAARRARFYVIDGFGYGGHEFDGGSFDLDYVRRRPNEQFALEPSVFHLLKLHGSVDWSTNGRAVSKTAGFPESPVLIYPSAAKYQLSYQQPYLEFMSRFQIALRQPNVGLVIVGFGFNDEHLNAPIEAALRSNIGLRATIFTPDARAEHRSVTIAWIEDLIQRGDRRLSMATGTFDDLVRHLPDTPSHEERDEHEERLSRSRGGSTT